MHFIDVLHFQYQIISSAGRQPWKPIEKIQWNLFIVQGVLAVKCFSLCLTLQDDVQEDVGIWEEPTRQASSLPMSDSFVCWVNGASYRCRISGIWLDGSFPMCAFVAVLYLRVPVCAGVFCMNVCQVQRTVSVQEDVDNREDGLTAVPKGGWPPPVVHWICVCDASLKYLNNPVHWSMEHIPMCVCNAQLLTSALDVFCNVFKKNYVCAQVRLIALCAGIEWCVVQHFDGGYLPMFACLAPLQPLNVQQHSSHKDGWPPVTCKWVMCLSNVQFSSLMPSDRIGDKPRQIINHSQNLLFKHQVWLLSMKATGNQGFFLLMMEIIAFSIFGQQRNLLALDTRLVLMEYLAN